MPPFLGVAGPHRTQSRLGRDLYLYTKWHLSPSSCLVTTDIGQKLEGCASLGEGELGRGLTQSCVG